MGYCHGLSTLWLYSKWADIQGASVKHNNAWFSQTIKKIATWDRKTKLKNEVFADFAVFSSLIKTFQFGRSFYSSRNQPIISLGDLTTEGKKLNQIYKIASVFQLEQLRDHLQTNILDNQLVMISYKIPGGYHDTGLFKHGDKYYYYNPMKWYGEVASSSAEEIAKIILKFNQSYNEGNNPAIGIIVNSFDDSPSLNTKELLGALNPLITNDALTRSAFIGSLDSLEFYLDKNPDLASVSDDGPTALMVASQNDHAQVVTKLLEVGAKPNQATRDGTTALMTACLSLTSGDHFDVVTKLIEHGADVNKVRNDGLTAIIAATQNNLVRVVRQLRRHGADLSQKIRGQYGAIEVATILGHEECLSILQEDQGKFLGKDEL